MRRNIAADADKMRLKAEAEYIRVGERGWQRRRNHIEIRNRRRQAAAPIAAMRAIEDHKLTLAAEAIFDAKHRPAGQPEAPDSLGREASLMGNAVEEGQFRRRQAQQLRRDQLTRSARQYEAAQTQIHKPLPTIRKSVLRASYDELLAAGWGDYERWRIPEDWKTHPPTAKMPPASQPKLSQNARNRQN